MKPDFGYGQKNWQTKQAANFLLQLRNCRGVHMLKPKVVRVVCHRSLELAGVPGGMFGPSTWLCVFMRAGHVRLHRADSEGCCFDILPPPDSNPDWADKMAAWLSAQHFNAVAAPPMPPEEENAEILGLARSQVD